jgi:Zn-finger nucleic acid-binding protein
MICSFCDTKMQLSEREGIQVSHCPQCGGIWLQRGALEGILARSSRAAPNERNRDDNQQPEDDDDGFPMQGGRREQRGEREERGGGIREFLGNLFDFG